MVQISSARGIRARGESTISPLRFRIGQRLKVCFVLDSLHIQKYSIPQPAIITIMPDIPVDTSSSAIFVLYLIPNYTTVDVPVRAPTVYLDVRTQQHDSGAYYEHSL